MDQAKDQAVRWLLGLDAKSVLEIEKTIGPSATFKVRENSLERINAYREKVHDLKDIFDRRLPAFGHDVKKKEIGTLKADVNRMRTDLLAELEKPMQETLDVVLTADQKKQGSMGEIPRNTILGWTSLDWIDAFTRYGLTAVGACLVVSSRFRVDPPR